MQGSRKALGPAPGRSRPGPTSAEARGGKLLWTSPGRGTHDHRPKTDYKSISPPIQARDDRGIPPDCPAAYKHGRERSVQSGFAGFSYGLGFVRSFRETNTMWAVEW